LVGSAIILSTTKESGDQFSALAIPYLGLAAFVLLVSFFFFKIQLPEVSGHEDHGHIVEDVHSPLETKSLFSNSHFVLAIVAQFFYVASQTGINSFFINYVTESIPSISDQQAGYILAFGGMGMFFIGRLSGSFVMGLFKPNKLLSLYALINILLMGIVVIGLGWISVVALFLSYFFMSIMFPTIFALGIKDLGVQTKRAASFIVMSIVGGAICPMLMGYIADSYNMRLGFIIPLIGFVVIAYYGFVGYKVKSKS
jgi:FHS family L-fucose permease-like MFS transporter